ncbi:hypothetical protein HanIR_Chr07g0335251 [Helianthus annuus]|nr:hypothetical protein HanIR_Chr07g0335251 [Helianthus annuus]
MLPLNRLFFNASLQSLSVTIAPPVKNQTRRPQLGMRIGIIRFASSFSTNHHRSHLLSSSDSSHIKTLKGGGVGS